MCIQKITYVESSTVSDWSNKSTEYIYKSVRIPQIELRSKIYMQTQIQMINT